MEKQQLIELFKKYHDGTCTEEEKALLEDWYLKHNEDEELDLAPRRVRQIGKNVFRTLAGNHNQFLKIGGKLLAAAAIFGVFITVMIQFIYNRPDNVKLQSVVHDVRPGNDKAILKLATGEAIDLTSHENGEIFVQKGIQVYKNIQGQISYKFTETDIPDHGQNTIETPNGGQWKVELSDGTKVWLNAASSLSFPASFSKLKSREVTLIGEAYFEVAKDKSHPFLVNSEGQQVEVLGTHFNINSYTNEPFICTTLAEGRVKISGISTGVVKYLSPGQKATLSAETLSVTVANVKENLAWVNGQFIFNDESIQSVMRKIARWYDVEVQYEGTPSPDGLNGRISRYKNISQVLKALEATQTIHFKMEGRRVIVMK